MTLSKKEHGRNLEIVREMRESYIPFALDDKGWRAGTKGCSQLHSTTPTHHPFFIYTYIRIYIYTLISLVGHISAAMLWRLLNIFPRISHQSMFMLCNAHI